MALRVTSRALELALAPAYHASTTVRSNPNAVIATTMPTTVSVVRSLCLNAFLKMSRSRYMVANPNWLAVTSVEGAPKAYLNAVAATSSRRTAWKLLLLFHRNLAWRGNRDHPFIAVSSVHVL